MQHSNDILVGLERVHIAVEIGKEIYVDNVKVGLLLLKMGYIAFA